MNVHKSLLLLAATGLWIAGCGESPNEEPAPADEGDTHTHADGTTHSDHADGDTHADHDEETVEDHEDDPQDHAHDETPLDPAQAGDMEIQLAQGHGAVAPGKESHLVVKLPYSDGGTTIVRAWIGAEDRTLSYVGKGEYAPSHDDYDVHATAPDPLPENAMWWIEIERPDGTKLIASTKPILE